MYEEILYEVTDPVATITLNRPAQLNAWTDRMAAEVKHAMARAEADPAAVVIVLTGAGRGFCAGADLKRLQAISVGKRGGEAIPELAADPGDPAVGDSFRGTYTYLMSIRKPVVAAVNGACAGMAVPIALCCDLRFAADRRRLHDGVLAARARRRVGALVAAAARSSGRRTRSTCSSRRARSAPPRPSASAS